MNIYEQALTRLQIMIASNSQPRISFINEDRVIVFADDSFITLSLYEAREYGLIPYTERIY